MLASDHSYQFFTSKILFIAGVAVRRRQIFSASVTRLRQCYYEGRETAGSLL
jgi:hypothetical protein